MCSCSTKAKKDVGRDDDCWRHERTAAMTAIGRKERQICWHTVVVVGCCWSSSAVSSWTLWKTPTGD